MPRNARTRRLRDFHLQQITRLYLHERKSQDEIAATLGITQQQVSYDLRTLHKRWQESAINDISAAQAEELARIHMLEREYFDAWTSSRADTTRTYQEKSRDERGRTRYRGGLTKETRSGDPRFLEGVRWCIAKRLEILGIDGPLNDEGPTDTTTPVTDDQRARAVARLLERLRASVSDEAP